MREPEVPRDHLRDGIERCLRKARDLFESALLLVDASRIDAAANLFVLAAQEVGKAKLLREALDSGDSRPRITHFSNHRVKVDRAATVLGSTAMWLKSGAFQYRAFQSNAFDVAIPADEPTRLEVLYVNYGSSRWLDPPPLEADDLRLNITRILDDWPSLENKLLN